MVFGVIYVQFSRKFWFSDRSYFWGHFSTLCANFQSEFSTPHPGPKAILGYWITVITLSRWWRQTLPGVTAGIGRYRPKGARRRLSPLSAVADISGQFTSVLCWYQRRDGQGWYCFSFDVFACEDKWSFQLIRCWTSGIVVFDTSRLLSYLVISCLVSVVLILSPAMVASAWPDNAWQRGQPMHTLYGWSRWLEPALARC